MLVYCVCAWDQYYPCAGTGNIIRAFTNRDDAYACLEKMEAENEGDECPFDHLKVEVIQVD